MALFSDYHANPPNHKMHERGTIFSFSHAYIQFNILPRMSLHYKLDPVQYQEHELAFKHITHIDIYSIYLWFLFLFVYLLAYLLTCLFIN